MIEYFQVDTKDITVADKVNCHAQLKVLAVVGDVQCIKEGTDQHFKPKKGDVVDNRIFISKDGSSIALLREIDEPYVVGVFGWGSVIR